MVGSSTPTGRKARRNPTVCTHAFPSKKKPSFPGPTERSAPDPPPRTPTQHRKSTGTRRKLERRSHHFFHHSQLIRNHMARSFLSPPPKSRSGLHLPCTAAMLSVSISLHFPKSTSDPSGLRATVGCAPLWGEVSLPPKGEWGVIMMLHAFCTCM